MWPPRGMEDSDGEAQHRSVSSQLLNEVPEPRQRRRTERWDGDVEEGFLNRNSRAETGERRCSHTSFSAYSGKRGMKGLQPFIRDAGHHARPLEFIPSSGPRVQGKWISQG